MKADWKLDEKFPTSKVVWKKLLRPVMPADPEDIVRLFGLMRFLDHTHDADKHDGLTSVHVPSVLLVTKREKKEHTPPRDINRHTDHTNRGRLFSNASSLHETIGKSR